MKPHQGLVNTSRTRGRERARKREEMARTIQGASRGSQGKVTQKTQGVCSGDCGVARSCPRRGRKDYSHKKKDHRVPRLPFQINKPHIRKSYWGTKKKTGKSDGLKTAF